MDFDTGFRDPQRVEVSGLCQSGHSPPRFFEKLDGSRSPFSTPVLQTKKFPSRKSFKLEYLEQKLKSDDIIVLS